VCPETYDASGDARLSSIHTISQICLAENNMKGKKQKGTKQKKEEGDSETRTKVWRQQPHPGYHLAAAG